MNDSPLNTILLEAAIGETTRDAFFGRPIDIPVHVLNRTGQPVVLERLTVAIDTDLDVTNPDPGRFSFSWHGGLPLEPLERGLVRLTVTPPLDALPYTNYFRVTGEASTPGTRKPIPAVVTATRGWLLLKETPRAQDGQVFVSFKDPQNEALAALAKKYLARAGLRPYRASDDTQTGVDIWIRKIFPAIEASAGVLVIWTPNTAASPDSVLKEMLHAKERKIPTGLFLSSDSSPPAEYLSSVLEYYKFDPSAPHAALADGIAAAAKNWRLGRPVFAIP